MATDKTPNYSDSQVALINSAIAANGGIANQTVAETLAADPAMNVDEKTPRTARMIIAKMARMNVNYERKAKLSKNGTEVAKKADLAKEIAALVDADAAKLETLEKASKAALEILRDALTVNLARAA